MRRFIPQLALMLAALLGLAACGGSAEPAAGSPTEVLAAGYKDVTVGEFARMMERKDFVLINTHIPYEGELAQTDAFIPFDETNRRLGDFPPDKDAKIVLYCKSGRMSAIAAEELVRQGYTNVWNVKGGMVAWEQAGHSLIRK